MGIYNSYFSEFPDYIKYLDDPEWATLGNILDSIDSDLLNAIKGLGVFWDIDKVPTNMLPYLSFAFNARVEDGDSEVVKRKKIASAVSRHRVKGQESSILELIYEVTGVMPEYVNPFNIFCIWESKNNPIPVPYDFMRWSSREDQDVIGMVWQSKNSSGDMTFQRGDIYIDIKLETAPVSTIKKVVRVVEYAGAVYFRYHVGFFGSNGWYEYRRIY